MERSGGRNYRQLEGVGKRHGKGGREEERQTEREMVRERVGPGNPNTEREKEREGGTPIPPCLTTSNVGRDIPCETP